MSLLMSSSLSLYLSLCRPGHVSSMRSPHHSDQMSQRSPLTIINVEPYVQKSKLTILDKAKAKNHLTAAIIYIDSTQQQERSFYQSPR